MNKYSFRSTFDDYGDISAADLNTAIHEFCNTTHFKILFKDHSYIIDHKTDSKVDIVIVNNKDVIQEVIFVRETKYN